MKISVFLIAACLCFAQAPPPSSPDTVVAQFPDGKKLTLGELQQMLQTYPPQFMQEFQRNQKQTIQHAFIVQYTAAQADKLKLAEQSPVKEQLEIMRMNLISSAMFSWERNHFPVSEADTDAYYEKNKSRYEAAEVKAIKLAFLPGKPEGDSIEDKARHAFEVAHAGTDRSEAATKKLAEEIIKKLRAGADFAALAKQYSDDEESKNAGGDFGTVKPTSPYADDFKKAVLALKVGQVSEPIQVGTALWIARVEKKTAQPINEVRTQIIDELKDNHLREYVQELEKRFDPTILRPDVLAQLLRTR